MGVVHLLEGLESGKGRPAYKAWVAVPVLLSGEWTSTRVEPAKSLYAMRECIAGFYSTVYWKELGTLALFLIPALLLGLLLRKPVIRLNDAFTEKLESTKLI